INVTLSVFAFRTSVDSISLSLWAVASYGVGVMVFLRWAIRKRQREQSRQSLPVARKFRATRNACLFGVMLAAPWGLLGVWLLGNLPKQQELILIALCVGMSASGSVLLSATYPAALTYAVCILAPVALKCFLILDGHEYFLLGALTLSYLVFLFNCISSCAKVFADKNRAVEELSKSLIEIENARRETERANRRFEAALQNMPQGLV